MEPEVKTEVKTEEGEKGGMAAGKTPLSPPAAVVTRLVGLGQETTPPQSTRPETPYCCDELL